MLAVLKNNALICVKEEDLKGHTHKWQIVKLLITRCIHNGHKKISAASSSALIYRSLPAIKGVIFRQIGRNGMSFAAPFDIYFSVDSWWRIDFFPSLSLPLTLAISQILLKRWQRKALIRQTPGKTIEAAGFSPEGLCHCPQRDSLPCGHIYTCVNGRRAVKQNSSYAGEWF